MEKKLNAAPLFKSRIVPQAAEYRVQILAGFRQRCSVLAEGLDGGIQPGGGLEGREAGVGFGGLGFALRMGRAKEHNASAYLVVEGFNVLIGALQALQPGRRVTGGGEERRRKG